VADDPNDDIPFEAVDSPDILTAPNLAGLPAQPHQPTEETVARWVGTFDRLRETSKLLAELVQITTSVATRLLENLPQNWPRDSRLNNASRVLDDGIPIVYVPRAEIVREILEQDDYESRARIVADNRVDISDDCGAALDSRPLHFTVADLSGLVHEAVAVLRVGRFAAAQSLAVNVSDHIVRRTMDPKWKYRQIVDTINESSFEDELLNVSLAFRPALPFYAFWPFGSPPPPQLNRHCTVHGLSADHASEKNATVSVMLATSLAMALTEWRQRIDNLHLGEDPCTPTRTDL
jgi:hypothetical protein